MVEDVGGHAAQPGDLVDDLAVVRQHLAEVHAALAVAAELSGRAEQRLIALEEGEAPALHQARRRRLAAELVELWFVLEQLQLARCASHVQVDDTLRSRQLRRLPSGQRVRRIDLWHVLGGGVADQQLVERNRTQAEAAVAEKMSPCLFVEVQGQSWLWVGLGWVE